MVERERQEEGTERGIRQLSCCQVPACLEREGGKQIDREGRGVMEVVYTGMHPVKKKKGELANERKKDVREGGC